MINAFKRLVHNNGQVSNDKINDDKKRLSAGVSPMDLSLQKKFSKGVQYNMKIIIRGDKNVGKSALFLRLQGESFKEDYLPTEEIQVANIEWNYNVTDDKVKVEIWEICDKSSKKRKPVNELKLNEKKNSKHPVELVTNEPVGLDAEFIDVYKNTNGVIMIFDLTKNWTFEYVEKEIDNIPKNIPILILGNHIDQSHHDLPISKDKVNSFIETIERDRSGQIRYAETSMRNTFGLKFLYKWFNLPFLHLKQQSLLKQLQTNEREIHACNLELNAIQESDDQNYERFLYTIQNRRRELADKLSQVPKSTKPDNNLVSKSVPFNLAGISSNGVTPNLNQIIKPTPSIVIGANNPLPIPKNYPITSSKSSNNNSISREEKIENETEDQAKLRQFLEEAIEVKEEMNKNPFPSAIQEDSDNDDDLDQPKILSYQDELDPEDQIEGGKLSSILIESIETENKDESIDEIKEPIVNSLKEQLNVQDKNDRDHKKINGDHKENSRKNSKKKEINKISINLVDNLPDKSMLEKSHLSSSKTKKNKKSKKSLSNDKEKFNKKKTHIEDLLGQPFITPIDQGPSEGDEYIEL